MRLVPIAATGLTMAVLAGAASVSAVGAGRQSAFAHRAAALEATWDADVAAGVPAASFAPLRSELKASAFQAGWWSPTWWTQTGSAELDSLQRRTDGIWTAAVLEARQRAQTSLDAWAQLVTDFGSFVPSTASALAASWPAQLQSARSPAELITLAATWSTDVSVVRREAQTAQLDAQVGDVGGIAGLLTKAEAALRTTQADNLDSGQLAALIGALQAQLNSGANATQAANQLLAALKTAQSLIALNNTVSSGLRPLLLSADQAAAEGVPGAPAFLAQYSGASTSLRAATTAVELTAVQQQIATAQAAVNQELAADACGHSVGSGKVITINLTLQEAVFYQDGCEVQATPITTGRAELRTPTGTFHVFTHSSPFQFISPWPKSSPFYYYPSWVSWVMEFASGGYFLHDAPWEPNWQYGPGSENSSGASHGCIHIPTDVMRWAYQWTPNGTPVIITN